MKKILIIDDSALMRRIFCDIISTDDRFTVEDTAANGIEGLKLLKDKTYDLILLDLFMPKMDGITFLKEYNRLNYSSKVVIISTVAGEGTAITIEALSLGAVDFIKKPHSISELQSDKFSSLFYKVISSVLFHHEDMTAHFIEKKRKESDYIQPERNFSQSKGATKKIVAIASSTGGPKALMEVLPYLPRNLDAPVLVVQHMPVGFTESLAKRIDSVSMLHVQEAADGAVLSKGNVYLAKGGLHMKVRHAGGMERIELFDGHTREGVKPCANYMFESLAETDYQEITCVVLTGMGADGTEGIENLKETKSVYVISQSKETCAVYGMPRCVDMAGITDESVPLNKVAEAIIKNVGVIKDGR